MGVSEFIDLPELLRILYLTNIFPLTLSLSPKERGEDEGDISWLSRKKKCYLLCNIPSVPTVTYAIMSGNK
jgi:hypothetical protein